MLSPCLNNIKKKVCLALTVFLDMQPAIIIQLILCPDNLHVQFHTRFHINIELVITL